MFLLNIFFVYIKKIRHICTTLIVDFICLYEKFVKYGTTLVVDFISLYLRKQLFMYRYMKVDIIKFKKLMTIFKISTLM